MSALPVDRFKIITDKKFLHRRSSKISAWSGRKLGIKLITFIYKNNIDCLGLSAVQIGQLNRVFVMMDKEDFAIFINPKIVEIGPTESEKIEACLSLPGEKYKVTRPDLLVVKDLIRDKPFELEGWNARVFAHELDHLNGKLISDIGTKVE